ncbi:GNAT family N-acetyltransferase [soil metagenome]
MRAAEAGEVSLSPMSESYFRHFSEAASVDYADQNVRAGRWPADGAAERSRIEFQGLLPEGRSTPDHHLFEIRLPAGETVGWIWMAAVERAGQRSGYVYNVSIEPGHRRNGYAQAAFLLLETVARDLGLASIGLHVFGHNAAAQALYARLGYGVTGLNMQKMLIG